MKHRWNIEVEALIKANVTRSRKAMRGKAKIVQESTVATRERRIRQIGRDLVELELLPFSVDHLKEKHVVALVKLWESKGFAAKTLQGKLAALRALLDWTGKRATIRNPASFLTDRNLLRTPYLPPKTRCWTHLGVDPVEQFQRVRALDSHVAMQLCAIHGFGLSRAEAIRFKPCRADKGTFISVNDGTRGRRGRHVGPLTPEQRGLLEDMKRFVDYQPERSLSKEGSNLERATERFKYVMKKAGLTRKALGVTAWGLARDYELTAGVGRQASVSDAP